MEEIIQQLKDYLAKGISQAQVAKACGISNATLSYFIKGTYGGDAQSIADKVADFLRIEETREATKCKDGGVIRTSTYVTIHKFLDLVLTHRVAGMLTGDAGAGKTTALKAFAKEHSSVILIEADHGYTARALFDELCAHLAIDDRGSLHQKLVRVVDKLLGSGRMIIIDEAEHLPYRALEMIRRVHDKAEVGLALCGMPRLEKNVQGDREHYAQLYSRISAPCRAKPLNDNDIRAYLGSRFDSFDAKCVAASAKLCRRNFRLLSHLIRWSVEIMRKNALSSLDEDVLEQASEMLEIAR
ncbi:MAG: AAA family ATPase [Sphaerochaetaceae bacterium]